MIRFLLSITISILFSGIVWAATEQPLANCFQSVKTMGRANNVFTEECRKSIEYYKKAIEINPDSTEDYIRLSKSLGFALKFEEALSYNDKAIAISPNDWTPHHDKAMNLVALKRYDEAQIEFKKSLEVLKANEGNVEDITYVKQLIKR